MIARDVSVSELFDEMRKLNRRILNAEEKLAKVAALPDRWDAVSTKPGAFYPEASAWADGVDGGYQRAADELRAVLGVSDG